jgi:hypothetical protein
LVVISEEPLAGAPVLPRFRVLGPRQWEITMVAVPSQVVVKTGAPTHSAVDESSTRFVGENGGFAVRVALLVSTIVLWIPLYFWWATRRRDGDDEGAL